MKYIIYSRVSTKKQQTIAQVQKCIDYVNGVKQSGDEIIFFDEEDKTTRLPWQKRTKLKEMLDKIKPGDTLVVYSLDRIARKGTELSHIYVELLTEKGIKVISLLQPYVGTAQIYIHAFIAEMEREHISIKTKDALIEKQNRLEKVGTEWYGFKTDPNILNPNENARTHKKPYKLIPDNKEFEACTLMIRLQSEGYSYQQIAEKLSDLGYANRAGKPFQKMTVYRVLQRKERYNLALAV